ncbi:MAG: hypothetical protein IJ584_11865 [Bacteroidales bacterium]|nr:hypothetical protein [Bacteroidales bacterium]
MMGWGKEYITNKDKELFHSAFNRIFLIGEDYPRMQKNMHAISSFRSPNLQNERNKRIGSHKKRIGTACQQLFGDICVESGRKAFTPAPLSR